MYISKTKEIYSLIIVYLSSSELDMSLYRKRYLDISNDIFKKIRFWQSICSNTFHKYFMLIICFKYLRHRRDVCKIFSIYDLIIRYTCYTTLNGTQDRMKLTFFTRHAPKIFVIKFKSLILSTSCGQFHCNLDFRATKRNSSRKPIQILVNQIMSH